MLRRSLNTFLRNPEFSIKGEGVRPSIPLQKNKDATDVSVASLFNHPPKEKKGSFHIFIKCGFFDAQAYEGYRLLPDGVARKRRSQLRSAERA